MDTLVLTNREFARLAGISLGNFYQLKRAGQFTGLESPIPHRWSREKVEAFLQGRVVASPRRRNGRTTVVGDAA